MPVCLKLCMGSPEGAADSKTSQALGCKLTAERGRWQGRWRMLANSTAGQAGPRHVLELHLLMHQGASASLQTCRGLAENDKLYRKALKIVQFKATQQDLLLLLAALTG